jgi:hypothetical protein
MASDKEEIKEITNVTPNNTVQNQNVAMKYGEKIFLRMSGQPNYYMRINTD